MASQKLATVLVRSFFAKPKGHGVLLLGSESTGAVFTACALLLKILGKASTAPGTHDATVYGTSRASPHCFYAHHIAAISSAIVLANALTVLNECRVLHGL